MPSVDLHVHSSHSDRPYSWFLRSNKSAECYTLVDEAYAIAKRRGMDLVTLADHDTIDGALDLCARHPGDTFVSVEVSARFPEDGCIVHVICIDIDEQTHGELQRLRRNVYELATFVEQRGIAHFWCHPLSQVNGRLTQQHLERCFLMFRAIELRNGTRDVAHEKRLLEITRRLTPATLELWAADHPQAPFINREARWAHVAGSDDHGTLAIARAYTRFEGAPTVTDLALALRAGTTTPAGESGTETTLAHNCYGVLAGYLNDNQRRLGAFEAGAAGEVLGALIDRRTKITQPDPDVLWDGGHTTKVQEVIRSRIEPALAASWRGKLDRLAAAASQGDIAAAADALPAIVKGLAIEMPYLLAYRYHARDRRGAERFAGELGVTTARRPRIAIVTDTIDEVNGVAIGLRKFVAEARRMGHEICLIGAGRGEVLAVDRDGIVRVPTIYAHRLAEYPEYAWSIPQLAPLVRYLVEQQIDLVQCATPGPMGVAGMIAGRLISVPTIGQYHTDVPRYAQQLTGDPAVGALVGALVGGFYRSLDRVFVPSRAAGAMVEGLGVDASKVIAIRRGIELAAYSPSRRTADAFEPWGITGGPVVLYVGRVSREKSVEAALAAFAMVQRKHPAARMVVVGDGPQRAELAAAAPPGCAFTGYLTGPDLARLYASADIFLFPSVTETFGNVIVEAQASGLPVIVAANTATAELMRDGVTGFAVAPDSAALAEALGRLVADSTLRERMRRQATQLAAMHDLPSAVAETFAHYDRILEGTRSLRNPDVSQGLVA